MIRLAPTWRTRKTMTHVFSGALTDVAGLLVGHFAHPKRSTGCTVVLAPDGVVAGVDVRGAAPGTRETDLLDAGNLVDQVHAVVLCGGSAFGLDAASGVVRWLEEQNIGWATPHGRVPIVPAAVLYDLAIVADGDDARARPDARSGYQAAQAACSPNPAEGNVGAGLGATVGKLFGMRRAMKGGIGQASVQVGPWTVSALIACNAVGDVTDPASGVVLAGARSMDGRLCIDTQKALLRGDTLSPPAPGSNTTIGVIACNALLSKAQAKRLAMSAHDGLARAVRPAHTTLDGDTLFALATGACSQEPDLLLLGVMAAEACASATVRAVTQAQGLPTVHGFLPSANDLLARSAPA
jgi:L-aminopeptidase/D-esterase-like protein